MQEKIKEKKLAIKLRKEGLSYSEILKKISVAKSTLSLWLQSVGLSIPQKQHLTEKRLMAARRGGLAKKNFKIKISEEIKNKARSEIKGLSDRELWLIGTALYWAEGSKEKRNAQGITFTNSDPLMIKFFLNWIQQVFNIKKENIYFEIYLHKTAATKEKEVKDFWKKIINFPNPYFTKIRWKKNKINSKRKNIGENYFGLLRINVRKSSNLNRMVAGWIDGICKN